MAYTQAEYEELRNAYLSLLKGAQAVQVGKGDKSIRYSEANLAMLRREINHAELDLGLTVRRAYAKNGGRSS